MTDPITPPTELIKEWMSEFYAYGATPLPGELTLLIATRAAQWGADQELEACCEWLVAEPWFKYEHEAVKDLRAARRPEPPSLKEQALIALDDADLDAAHENILRRALEALPDD